MMRLLLLVALLEAAAWLHAQPQRADLIVTNGCVVTMNDKKDIIEKGAVVIRDAHIVAVGPAAIATQFAACRTP